MPHDFCTLYFLKLIIMKKLIIAVCTITFICSFTSVNAQSEAEMKAWMDYMTPGEMHQLLAKDDGEWNEEITSWMAPGAPPQKMAATCINKMIMGGRYQESIHTGNMMGMPFEGRSIAGYDNGRKIFVYTWIDNMSSGIMTMEGTWNATTKTMHYKGTTTDPMTGKSMPVRETFKYMDDGSQLLEMFMMHEGKEFKSMEIKFTRKK
jgi:hypothetical protein